MVDDARTRIKTLLDSASGLSAAAITKDDDATAAAYAVIFGAMPSFIDDAELFADTDPVDAIFFIGNFDSEPLIGFDKKAYAYHEIVPIDIITTDKTGITADKLENKCAQELRRIFETYPYVTTAAAPSLRGIRRIAHAPEDMGGWWLHKATYMIDWKRPQENAAPTAPTFSESIAWTYEGDRLSGGSEGVWDVTNHLGGSTTTFTVNSENNLDCYISVFVGDSYTHNETSLGVTTSLAGRIRFRYKTTSNATAKVTVTGTTGTQTVLSETASSTWTVVDVALVAATVGATTNTVNLYACDGTGHVYYDFVQIYNTNYILPNCVEISPPFFTEDAVIAVPGRSGEITQAMGTKLMEIHMTCDLSMEYSTVLWQRPQSAYNAGADYNNFDVFLETIHEEGGGNSGLNTGDYLWVWLDLGSPAMQFKARLVEMTPSFKGDGDLVELVWREYRHGSAAAESTSERFGLSL